MLAVWIGLAVNLAWSGINYWCAWRNQQVANQNLFQAANNKAIAENNLENATKLKELFTR